MDSWIDKLPSQDRRKIREKLRSESEYERLREKVKGPEDLEREMRWNEVMANLSFALESEPRFKEGLKERMEKDLKEQGMEKILDQPERLSDDAKGQIDRGAFDVGVEPHPDTAQDALTVLPEGIVAEKAPVQRSVTEQYASGLGLGGH